MAEVLQGKPKERKRAHLFAGVFLIFLSIFGIFKFSLWLINREPETEQGDATAEHTLNNLENNSSSTSSEDIRIEPWGKEVGGGGDILSFLEPETKIGSGSIKYLPEQEIKAKKQNTHKAEEAPSLKSIGNTLDKVDKEIYAIGKKLGELIRARELSPYYKQVRITAVSRAPKTNTPEKEYVTIQSKSKEKIKIAGWKIKSAVTGQEIAVSDGVYLPFPFEKQVKLPIYLSPGQKAIINTSISPVGYSFQTNKCIGYFNQSYTFKPTLSNSCPKIKDEKMPEWPNTFSDVCLEFIKRLPSCRSMTTSLSQSYGSGCQTFITERASYGGCLNFHKNDADFYKNAEWRVYLNRSGTLWKNKKETLNLLDQNGKIVDTRSY